MMMKILFQFIVWVFVSFYGCTKITMADCELSSFMQELVETNGSWLSAKKLDKQDTTYNELVNKEDSIFPVAEISMQDGVIWVKTYRADFFPAKLSIRKDKLYLSGLKFLIPIPGGPTNQHAFKVKKYTSEDVEFTLTSFGELCERIDYFVLNIENIHTPSGIQSESLLFRMKTRPGSSIKGIVKRKNTPP